MLKKSLCGGEKGKKSQLKKHPKGIISSNALISLYVIIAYINISY